MDVLELLPRQQAGTAGLDPGERLVRAVLRAAVRPLLHPRAPRSVARRGGDAVAWIDARRPSAHRGVAIESTTVAGVRCEVVLPDRRPERQSGTIVYLHGGGHRQGSPLTHRPITTVLARTAGATVVVPDYRLAPEHPHPAGLHDALAVVDHLDDTQPLLAIAGDSAGGNLALAVALRRRDAGAGAAGCLALLSPWTDLRPRSVGSNARRDDAMLWPDPDGVMGLAYVGGEPDRLHDPLVSVIEADLRGLPPMLIQVGTEELLRDDSERLAERADDAGVDVTLERYGGMWHVHQLTAGLLPAADLALERAATFVRQHADRVA